MAYFKYVDEKYRYTPDLSNLLHYIIHPQNTLISFSNMVYSDNVSLLLTQWMYHHQYHHVPTDLAYHYILSFDPKHEILESKYFTLMNIMQDICNLDCFRNINLVMGIHKAESTSPFHIHIAADTINKVTGNRLFIKRSDLIDYLGKLLKSYQIPLFGYIPNTIVPNYTPIRFFSFAS